MAEFKPANTGSSIDMKGYLHKWTNYLKGYQKRWFVLSNGVLSYYRNHSEMSHTCRGSIRLQGAIIHADESCTFALSNSGSNTFHLKAANEAERQKWITAIELAKSKVIRQQDLEDEEEYDNNAGDSSDNKNIDEMIKSLTSKFNDVQTCTELLTRHYTALTKAIADTEPTISTASEKPQEVTAKIKALNERSALFRLTSGAVLRAATDYLHLVEKDGKRWLKQMTYEHEQRGRLQQMVEQLARQHSSLEQAAKFRVSKLPNSSTGTSAHSDDDEGEFYDAQDENEFVVQVPLIGHRRSSSGISFTSLASEGRGAGVENEGESSSDNEEGDTTISVIARRNKSPIAAAEDVAVSNGTVAPVTSSSAMPAAKKRQRRTRIPDKPYKPLNLWSIMRNCIGKELTKIPMPVNFSEPLSMLQRLVEDYEYSEILDKAAMASDSCEQLAYVAAFTVSSYATTSNRTAKPFNPLLGETYELDRTDDLGWKCISEQVSHHPPVVAQHCESKNWICHQEFSMTSSFKGKYLQVKPLGMTHLTFLSSGNHYTWRKVTTNVNNIILGKLWVDHHGDMEIVNHKTGDKCALKFIPYSYFSPSEQRKVTGAVMNAKGEVVWVLNGTWDNKMEAAKVAEKRSQVKGKQVLETEAPVVVWQRRWPPLEAEKYYNFSEFACQLNELEEGVAPTDSRLRPDQRLMEEGDWDQSNEKKESLENKQRATRRARELEAELAAQEGRPVPQYEPIWFKKEMEPITNSVHHLYKGGYWECKEKQNWSVCPDIF
ncbi:oxysterol-binding protein 1-like isoform X2 [Artemia franciscana]|uniref:PH domain-containing protein n=1 Tax=Artemia franciscana TaxID=6661 RepID=A0AA88I0G2_ARTSF|nr:hypothetical protein QYM36_004508 [Artemia franciscana]KAK2720638.1 hypothetical protein QYM36_004508 [Artemia franciscana]